MPLTMSKSKTGIVTASAYLENQQEVIAEYEQQVERYEELLSDVVPKLVDRVSEE